MPTQEAHRRESADYYRTHACHRLLEDSDRRWRLVGVGDKLIARIDGVTVFSIEQEDFVADRYTLRVCYLEHTPALQLLEGAPYSQIFGPNYLFLSGERAPVYDPRPRLFNVRIARVRKVPKEMRLEEAFLRLRA